MKAENLFEFESDSVSLEEIGGGVGMSPRATLFYLFLAFLLWFAASASVISVVARRTSGFKRIDPVFSLKMSSCLKQDERPEIVFVGASRAHRQIDIVKVREVLHLKCGREIPMYNLGVGGSSSTNIRFMLEELLKAGDLPRLIFVDMSQVDQWETARSARNMYYVPDLACRIWFSKTGLLGYATASLGSSMKARWEVALLGLEEASNYGMFARLSEVGEVNYSEVQQIGRYGFRPLEDYYQVSGFWRSDLTGLLERSPDWFRDLYASQYDSMSSLSAGDMERAVRDFAKPFLVGLDEELLDRVVLLFPPLHPASQASLSEIMWHGKRVPVVTFPVSRYPDCMNPDWYVDRGHFNRVGSERYSSWLADRMAELPGFQAVEPRSQR